MRLSPRTALAVLLLPACVESGRVLQSDRPGEPVDVAPRASALGTGDQHGCAIVGGALACWGANDAGQLGLGDTEDRLAPAAVGSELVFERLALGTAHSCALTTTGDVFCFGDNARGQLGSGTRARQLLPTRVALARPVTQLSCHFEHCCAIADDRSLWCWGKNEEGELGQGDVFPDGADESADALTPVMVGAARYLAVDTGQGHTCGVREDGTIWCWGRNSFHELGPEPLEQVRAPIRVGAATDWVTVVTGQHHSCGLKRDRSLWCWGRNTALQTGEGFPLGVEGDVVSEPTRVPLSVSVATVGTDTFHSCVIDPTGGLWCWGRNVEGQLGLTDRALRRAPEPIGAGFAAVDPGRFHTCALRLDGSVVCAGPNARGELGTGDAVARDQLSRVAW